MKNTKIEWTDHTFNPWEGCTKVSPGCANCYAEARNLRFSAGANWGKGAPRRRTDLKNWKQPLKWNENPFACVSCGKRFPTDQWNCCGVGIEKSNRVFCASLADWLDDEVPIEWLKDLLCLIEKTPNLDWLLLTKRPENFLMRIREVANGWKVSCEIAYFWRLGVAPKNIWIGTTIENEAMLDPRHHALMKIPALVHFWSCEPLLSSMDVTTAWQKYGKPQWVICGGESGLQARPMHPIWVAYLQEKCAAARIPFFFKQWGEFAPWSPGMPERKMIKIHASGKVHQGWVPNGDYRSICSNMTRVGKTAAGRLLDGKEWSQVPV